MMNRDQSGPLKAGPNRCRATKLPVGPPQDFGRRSGLKFFGESSDFGRVRNKRGWHLNTSLYTNRELARAFVPFSVSKGPVPPPNRAGDVLVLVNPCGRAKAKRQTTKYTGFTDN